MNNTNEQRLRGTAKTTTTPKQFITKTTQWQEDKQTKVTIINTQRTQHNETYKHELHTNNNSYKCKCKYTNTSADDKHNSNIGKSTDTSVAT